MDEFNVHGWSNIHEASYKGYTIAVNKFINYAKDTGKHYLINLKTIDDLAATPVLIAALGGSLDCMKALIDAGATLTETIKYKQKYDHGLLEISVIKQDMNILLFLYDKYKDLFNFNSRICSLMCYANNDDEIRASIGRTLEMMTEKTHIGISMKMRDELLKTPDFGRFFTIFLKQCVQSPEAFTSCVLIMVNILHIDEIRDLFIKTNGINSVIECIDTQRMIINKEVDVYKKLTHDSENSNYIETILNSLEIFETCNFVVASIGKCLAELAKYENCMEFINKENYGEKLINFTRLIFDFNAIRSKLLTIADNGRLLKYKADSVIIEQYIYTYISFLGTLVVSHEPNKRYFNESFLYEYILNLWHFVQPSLNSKHESELTDRNTASTVMTSSNYFEMNNDTTMTLSQMLLDQVRRKQSKLSGNDKNIKAQAFDFVPSSFKELQDDKGEPLVTPILIKLLKLAIIEYMGKVLLNNFDLKRNYLYLESAKGAIYLNKDKNWQNSTSIFINTLIEFLDPARVIDKEIRAVILKYLTFIFVNDKKATNQIIDYKNASASLLIASLKTLLLKSFAISVREEAMRMVWHMSGGDDEYCSQTEKYLIFKSITMQKFIDALYDNDFMKYVALDALILLLNGPTQRPEDGGFRKVINGAEELSRAHAIPALVSILKTKNNLILLKVLKTIPLCCVSIGYGNNYKNQITFTKYGTIAMLIDICKNRNNVTKNIKAHAFLCLSSLSIHNPTSKALLDKQLENTNYEISTIIGTLLMILVDRESQAESLEEQFDEIESRVTAGMALCSFFYHNEEYKAILISKFGKIYWKDYVDLINSTVSVENYFKNKSLALSETNRVMKALQFKCLLAFQIISLYTIIHTVGVRDIFNENNSGGANEDDDPRATGITIIANLIRNCTNSSIRTLAIKCLCGLVNTDKELIVEPVVSFDIVEMLGGQIDYSQDETKDVNEIEISDCAITLAFITDYSPEARRRLLRLGRKNLKVMEMMRYHNKSLNIDLLREWNHFEKLYNMGKYEMIENKLPPISKAPKSIIKLPKINV